MTVIAAAAIGHDRVPATTDAPRVVETSPANRTTIGTGPLTIRVTFDRPMRADSFSFVTTNHGRYPDCAKRPQQSPDGRSFTLACRRVQPGRYAIGFNGGRFHNFVGRQSGIPATPALLTFVVR